MARFPYDVNTTRRYIDVHKQFRGGLKTVDTDDALGAVFLREAENVSLSEFGFIEKRYGTFEKFRAGLNVSLDSKLQGYWEFLGKYIIIAIDGRLYYQLLSTPTSDFTEVTQFYTKDTLIYPNGLASYLGLESDFSVGSGFAGFQDDRPMGAVNISNVLYMFTGKYPVYFVEEDDVLKAYLFAKETPSYAELVVTGHNLLENDYDDLYYNTNTKTMNIGIERAENEEEDITIIDNDFFPEIPFAKDGTLTFNLNYDVKPEIVKPFVFNSTDETESILNTITLKTLKYRPSGPGATDLSFDTISTSNYTANTLNNATDDINESVSVITTPLSWNNMIEDIAEGSNLTTGTETEFTLKERNWTFDSFQVPESDPNTPDYKIAMKLENVPSSDTLPNLATFGYKSIDLYINDIPTTNTFESNKPMAFAVVDAAGTPIDFESRLQASQAQLNSYNLKDSRIGEFVVTVDPGNLVNFRRNYNIFWKNNETFIPIYNYSVNDTSEDIRDAKIEFKYNGHIYSSSGPRRIDPSFRGAAVQLDTIYVSLYDKDGDLFRQEYAYWGTTDNSIETNFSEFFKAFPMERSEREDFRNALDVINKGTIIELIEHDSQQSTDIVLETYRIGDNLTFEDGYYKFTLPDNLPPQSIQHYALRFKTTDVYIDSTPKASRYLTITSVEAPNYYEEPNITYMNASVDLNQFEALASEPLLYRPVGGNQLLEIKDESYKSFNNQIWKIYPIVDNVSISSKDEIGSQFLNVVINEGLLSGTFDFEFVYELKKEKIDYTSIALNQIETPVEFSYIIKDITISPEKLQDYTFFQGDKAHPIWSCNQVIDHFNKLMVWGSEEMPTALFYSFPDRPFYFPSKFYLQFTNDENLPINSVAPYSKILVVQTESQTWGVKGNSGLVDAPSPYIEFSINPSFGTIAPKSVRPVRNKLFFLSRQGIVALTSLYAVDDTYNIDIVDRNITNIVYQDKDAVGIQFDNQYWLNFPNYSITLRWYIDKNAWVKDVYQGWNDFNGVFKYQLRDGKLEFITYPSESKHLNGQSIYKIGVDYKLPTDLTETIFTKFETSFLNQNYPFHPKNYKEAKLDFTLQNEYNQSRDAVYSMDDNEDMPSEFLHIVEDAPVEANHSYKLQYDFNPEYNIVDPGTFSQNYSDIYDGGTFNTNSYLTLGSLIFRGPIGTYDGGSFNNNSYNTTDGGTFSTNLHRILGSLGFVGNEYLGAIDSTFDHLVVESVSIKEYDTDTVQPVYNLVVGEDFITFQVPNEIKGNKVDIQVVGNFTNYVGGADLYDITYDDALFFKTWILSEAQTLNLDNINSYDQAKADIDINFNDRLGTWVFGTSDFGKKVTAVKTIKLSGKGYNAKIYMEDTSKSKWTLESLGLTYKMKRARSR